MLEVAIFGAGCFWGVEERFRTLAGVSSTQVGYCGGDLPETDYQRVCTGTTNHAEVVLVEFNPDEISYQELLKVFWENHNPTTLNRQGPDMGTQYRSVVFYTTDEQAIVAKEELSTLVNSKKFSKPVVTEICPKHNYVKAEENHQQYLMKRGQTTCGI